MLDSDRYVSYHCILHQMNCDLAASVFKITSIPTGLADCPLCRYPVLPFIEYPGYK